MSKAHERKVIMNGAIFFYKQKAPFVASGMSFQGAIEYDSEEDKLRCHECGYWFSGLGVHIWTAHKMRGREYKRKHLLNLSTALANEKLREQALKNGERNVAEHLDVLFRNLAKARPIGAPRTIRMEAKNARGNCPAQLLHKIKALADEMGRTPTVKEFFAHGIPITSAIAGFNVKNVRALMSLAHLLPNDRNRREIPREVLIEMLRDFYVKFGRLPRSTDFRRGLLPQPPAICRVFGGLPEAYEAAGLGNVRHQEVA